MQYRNATLKDIPGVSKLQQKYHISTIREEDKPYGFVTTLFTEEQYKELIEKEQGLAVACDGDKIVATLHILAVLGAVRCFSMIEDLPNVRFRKPFPSIIPTNTGQFA